MQQIHNMTTTANNGKQVNSVQKKLEILITDEIVMEAEYIEFEACTMNNEEKSNVRQLIGRASTQLKGVFMIMREQIGVETEWKEFVERIREVREEVKRKQERVAYN